MWLHRVLFNVRHRLLNQKSSAFTDARPIEAAGPKAEEKRARVIHNRIADLDARSQELLAR